MNGALASPELLPLHPKKIARRSTSTLENMIRFFFGGNGEQNRNHSGDPKNCGK